MKGPYSNERIQRIRDLAATVIPGHARREDIGEPAIFIHHQDVKLPTTWRRAMHAALFTPCQVEYGEGKKVRGQMIICGKCGSVGRVPLNTVPFSTGNDDRQVELLAMRKFSNLGWQIGKTTSRHRCPTCIGATKPFAEALAPLKKEDAPVNTNGSEQHEPEGAEAPREMTRDDRRVIFAKLQDCYDNERTGYAAPWTDKRVADDLGVPKAWVSKVRDENFGPDHNAEFVEQLAYARAVVEDVKAVHRDLEAMRMRHAGEMDALIARVKPMLIVMEKTERTIAGIEKAMVA